MSVAFSVCQVNSVDWPCWIEVGLAVKVAVGSTGAGTGGGGGGGAVFCNFFWAAPKNKTVAMVSTGNAPPVMRPISLFTVVLRTDRAQRREFPVHASPRSRHHP